MTGSRRPVWRRNLWVLVGAQAVTVSAMSIVLPFIPFFVRELGVTDRASVERWSGLIFSGPFLAAALMAPIWGHLGDKYGHKIVVVRAIAGLAVVNFLLTLIQSPMQFWIVRLIQGLVTGFIPAALAITTSTTPADRLPDALGKLHASASAGRLVGPALGGVLAGFLGFREIFLVVGAAISVAAVAVILWLEDPPSTVDRSSASILGNFHWVMGDARTQLGLVGLTIGMAAVSVVMPIFPLYVEDLLGPGRDPAFWTGIGFACVAGATLAASAGLGPVADRVGLKVVLVGALGVGAVSLAVHPLVSGLPGMLAARALLGLATAGIAPVLHTMISRNAPAGIRGGITGWASSATILGFFLGPFSGGWIASQVGVDAVFYGGAGVLVACSIVAAFVARRLGRDRAILAPPEPTPR